MKTLKDSVGIGFVLLRSGRAAKFEVMGHMFFLRKKGLALEFGVNDPDRSECILVHDAEGMANDEITTEMLRHMMMLGRVKGYEDAKQRVLRTIEEKLGL